MNNKPASLLVVPLGMALSGINPSWCGRQMAGEFSASSYKRINHFLVIGGKYATKYYINKKKLFTFKTKLVKNYSTSLRSSAKICIHKIIHFYTFHSTAISMYRRKPFRISGRYWQDRHCHKRGCFHRPMGHFIIIQSHRVTHPLRFRSFSDML